MERLQAQDQDLGDAKVLRLARIPRIYRIFRVFRLFKLLRVFKTGKFGNMGKLLKLGNSVKQIGQIIGSILFLTHITGCFWFFQAKFNFFPDNCWVVQKEKLYETPFKQYIISFYWAFQTLTTVGFGDISAFN